MYIVFQAEYISLSLEKGHVVFQYYLGNGTYGRLQSEFKHNTNKWVSVAVARRLYSGEFLLARAKAFNELAEAFMLFSLHHSSGKSTR